MKLTASNVVAAISRLPIDIWFDYVNPATRTQVCFVRADGPEGPIAIRRKKADGVIDAVSLSSEMLWRAANAFTLTSPSFLYQVKS